MATTGQGLLIVQDPENGPSAMEGQAGHRLNIQEAIDPMEDQHRLSVRFCQERREVNPGWLVEIEGLGWREGRSSPPALGPIPPRRDDTWRNLPDGRIARPLLPHVESGIRPRLDQSAVQPEGSGGGSSLQLLTRKMADPAGAGQQFPPVPLS